MPLFRLLDKISISLLHFLFDDATPTKPVIYQLTVPLVVVVRNLAFREHLLGRFSLGPCLRAGEVVRIALR